MRIKELISFASQSLSLDVKFIKNSEWLIADKIIFLFKKYFLIFKHFFKKFEFGKDFISLKGEKIFYDSSFGLAGYQSLLTRHKYLIKNIAKIDNADVVVDVGANVGFFSKLIINLFPQVRIYAFEPIPKTFACLKLNLKNDFNAKVYNLAISDYNGGAKMKFDDQESAVSMFSKDGDTNVKVIRLDDFLELKEEKFIDILKIDTETFENYVLLGADDILAKTKYLFIEVTIANNKNYTISSLFKLLSSDKYNFQLVGFRNYSNRGEGATPIIDMLLKNIILVDNNY